MPMPYKAVILTLALAGGAFAVGLPAQADSVSVAVGPAGGIAFGYRDGYWDRAHVWHTWANAGEAAAWRRANRAHYYAWAHDRYGDGWRPERWWDTAVVAPGVGVAVGPAGGVAVGVGLGGIAFGYSDGYWDRAHVWHTWRNAREAAAWRAANREHYFEQRHDFAGDGWREERWWERR